MNRLQKKCFFAASGFHLLLVVILIVGPAFLASRNDAETMQVLEFVPMMTTDKPFSGGGSPNAAPPPPAPAPVEPPPPQPPTPTPPPPEPQKSTPPPEPPKNDPDAFEPAKPSKPKIQVNTTLVKRKDVKSTTKTSTASTAESKAAAERARAFKVASSRLRDGLSSGTTVEMPGPGGGGPTYANYRQLVSSAYYNAWIEPEAEASTGTATVVVARDGTVLSAHITKSSGNPVVDKSIQSALDRVSFIAPFPQGSTDAQRSFNISFKLETKKSLG